MRISDWSSDVCSSDLPAGPDPTITTSWTSGVLIRASQQQGDALGNSGPDGGIPSGCASDQLSVGAGGALRPQEGAGDREQQPDEAVGGPDVLVAEHGGGEVDVEDTHQNHAEQQIGRASGRERVCKYV